LLFAFASTRLHWKTQSILNMSQNGTAPATGPPINPNDNNAYLVYIPSIVFVIVCPILMGLRIWARLRKGGKLGADDWTAVTALVSLFSSLLLLQAKV